MEKLLYPDFFNDVFGPIMQPGSSGGFAGPCRIGNVAASLVKGAPVRAKILVAGDFGSLAQLDTFMTDRGFIGGLLGYGTDDERLFTALSDAGSAGLAFEFAHDDASLVSGREVLFQVEGSGGSSGSLIAESIGGGMILIRDVNGFALSWKSDTFALIVEGGKEQIDALVPTLASKVSTSFVYGGELEKTPRRGTDAQQVGYLLELSEPPSDDVLGLLGSLDYVVLPAQLPVVTTLERKPQLFDTVEGWEAFARERGIGLVEAAVAYEQAFSGWTAERIMDRFELIARILDGQVTALERLGAFSVEETPVLPIYQRNWERYLHGNGKGRPSGGSLNNGLVARIIPYALSTNAKVPGVPIVPGPMGTGGGYLFSALKAVQEEAGFSHERLVEALVVAAQLGAFAFTHTVASGERGCVGESGVCCAMASGAIAYLAGGGAEEIDRAASMALQGSIGITCDPIPGGKEFPCLTRTVRAATTAPLYADLALAGIDPIVPYHQMLLAIEEHYRRTPPSFLSGGDCGVNCTHSAKECLRWLERLTSLREE